MKQHTKQERHQAIKQIIESKEISTQEELMSELELLGYEVTQATVSRDINELGLVKIRFANLDPLSQSVKLIYSLPQIERLRSLLNEFMASIDYAENLIVVKAAPGTAQALAAAIDSVQWENVLGTVGGDDTILIITRNKEQAPLIVDKIVKLKNQTVI